MKTWNIEEVTGYSPMYTFFEDFSIADIFGEEAIFDTFKRCMIDWKNDYKAMTEFSMALNWKCWEHYNNQDPKWKLYKLLYEKHVDWVYENLKGDELRYYMRITD